MNKKLSVCFVSGSERAGGNTSKVVSYIENRLANTLNINTINLADQRIVPCGSCGNCNYKKTKCGIKDDMPAIIKNLTDSDILIYLVPVHAFGMAHPMQIFLERAGVGYLRFERPLANKIGGCVIIGRRYNLGNVHDQIINNFLLNRLIIPGAGYPALIQGGKSGDVLQDVEGLASLDMLINRLCNVADALKDVKYQEFGNERKMVEIKEKNNKSWIHHD